MTLEDALGRLLAAWREVRSERLATLVERVDRALARPAIDAPTQRARDEQWFAVEAAGDPSDVGRLAAMLTDGYPARCKARIDRLAKRPPDPRIATAMLDLFGKPPELAWLKPASIDIWSDIVIALDRHADPRTARALAAQPRPEIANQRVRNRLDLLLRNALRRLPTAEPVMAPAQLSLCVEIETALGGSDRASDARVAELLAAIYAQPSDLAARAVYADALLERGDPRGELIQLQLARADDAPPIPREKELLSRHARVWLGPLAVVLHSFDFRAGFLARIALRSRLPPHDPMLATVETVDLDHSLTDPVAWVADPVFASLRAIEGVQWPQLFALANLPRPLPIERVGIDWWSQHVVPDYDGELRSLPALRCLDLKIIGERLSPFVASELLARPWLRAVSHVKVSYGRGTLAEWQAVFDASPQLARLDVKISGSSHTLAR